MAPSSKPSATPALTRLREGQLFGEHVQVVLTQLDDDLLVEEMVALGAEARLRARTPAGAERGGRADFFGIVRVSPDDDETTVVIDEMKASRWELMTPRRRRANLARYARQLWRYIDSVEAAGYDVAFAAVHFPWCPDPTVRAEVEESYTNDEEGLGLGISVVWWGETRASSAERRGRSHPRSENAAASRG